MREAVWPEAHRALRDDPHFGPLARAVGPVRLSPPADGPFAALVRDILYQQLAGSAAAAIHRRLIDVLDGTVTVERVLAAPDDALRSAGLSGSKARALRELADDVTSGRLDLASLVDASDREVEERLSRVWGIGPWTAHMFLLGYLRRPDVWPASDLGVRRGWAEVHGLSRAPESRELEKLGERYRPWRSAVAWYCWRAAEGAGEPV